jgi:choline dehydrogenase-like flavoprotein
MTASLAFSLAVIAGISLRARPSAAPRESVLHRLRGGQSEETWDYVIIGAGAAGCVLAERLSADPECRVLVLEAGTDGSRDMRIRIPAGLVKVFKSERDWDFETEPVRGSNRGVYLCRGKVLGGSSSTNVMLYHRGTPADYDSWVQQGAVGWGPSEVLDYYRRAERNVDGPSQYHGTEGPMPVDNVPYINELSSAFCSAAGNLGYRHNLDFNDWSAPQDGFGRFKVTQNNGERCSAYNAYLQGAERRPNLRVASGAHVTRVSLEGGQRDLCASGVEYSDASGDTKASLAAGGEVLLCAGAVQSPQILMLSGIGPKGHLESVGVESRLDLPGVGEGLQDHPAVLVSYGSKKAVSVTDDIRWFGTSLPNPVTLLRWLLWKKGALTSVACEFGGFFRTAKTQSQPDLQVRFIAARAMSADGISTLEKFGAGQKTAAGYTTQIIAIRPKSAGRVRLRSSNVMDKPLLDDIHLSDADSADVATLREGIKLGRKLCTAPEFDQYRTEEVYPSASVQSDAEIDAYVRGSVHSANALTGSCRMGGDHDSGAVLDAELRVRGVGSLRVIDASAMPHIIGGQTCAPTIMMAEKGADLVLRQRAALKSYTSHAKAHAQQAAAQGGLPQASAYIDPNPAPAPAVAP